MPPPATINAIAANPGKLEIAVDINDLIKHPTYSVGTTIDTGNRLWNTRALVDPGAMVNVMSKALADDIGVKLDESNRMLRNSSGDRMMCDGIFTADVKIKDKTMPIQFYVAEFVSEFATICLSIEVFDKFQLVLNSKGVSMEEDDFTIKSRQTVEIPSGERAI